VFFWDGRARSLEEQVLKPIEDENEMGFSVSEAAERIGVSIADMSRALASFVRTILSGDSPFDRFTNGDLTALTPEQRAGLQIFRGKGSCVSCHVGPNMTDERLHNTGVAWRDGAFVDRGAGRGEFKTPTLREVARTAPYMHDGTFRTLEEVVSFYDGGGRPNPLLDADIRPLHLTDVEKSQLVAFLSTLSGKIVEGSSAPRHKNDTPIARVQHGLHVN
jgi:cytochrome c peroxidase